MLVNVKNELSLICIVLPPKTYSKKTASLSYSLSFFDYTNFLVIY
jgi:hypothetical protein